MDVGTGTGRMIELFGRGADQAIGIDRSSKCSSPASSWRRRTTSSLRQGDMYALPLADESADTIIIHQVLHYALAGRGDRGAARVLAPRGRLLVVDFAARQREETLRASDAHIRLGFDDESMAAWFRAGGVTIDHVENLEGGQLTVTLWRGSKASVPQSERRRAAA